MEEGGGEGCEGGGGEGEGVLVEREGVSVKEEKGIDESFGGEHVRIGEGMQRCRTYFEVLITLLSFCRAYGKKNDGWLCRSGFWDRRHGG